VTPPEHVDLGDVVLERVRPAHATLVAQAVAESLDHLRPFMPWAAPEATDPDFQRRRIETLQEQWSGGENYEYVLVDRAGTRVLGSFGLMTRRGRGTLEIGYWVHAGEVGRGLATRAVAALTDAALRVRRVRKVLVYCDEANAPSAAIPRKLGFTLVRVEEAAPSAPGETGRQLVWVRDRPVTTGVRGEHPRGTGQ
jgi:RimJ/RimL family protein N-acetyltransferase